MVIRIRQVLSCEDARGHGIGPDLEIEIAERDVLRVGLTLIAAWLTGGVPPRESPALAIQTALEIMSRAHQVARTVDFPIKVEGV